MQTEFEVKILEIDIREVERRLTKIGAEKIKEREMRRYVYNISPQDKSSWIRLRDNGEKTTLTIKKIEDSTITGTKETEVEVGDFEKTNLILNGLGFFAKAYQENKRISYKFEDVEIEIDSWPKIPTYIEVEGRSEREVEKVVRLLGFEMKDTTSIGVSEVYKKYGLDIDKFKELKF